MESPSLDPARERLFETIPQYVAVSAQKGDPWQRSRLTHTGLLAKTSMF